MGYAKVRSFGRSKRAWRLGFLLALGVGMGAAIPLPQASAQTAPARRGEAFTFAVKMLGSLEAGRARLALSPPQPSPTGPIVRVIGESEALGVAKALTGWHMSYNLILDAATLLPKRMEQVDTGKVPREATFLVNGKSFEMKVKKPGGEWQTKGELRSELLDPMSVLLLLRGVKLTDGERLSLVVSGGTAVYRGELTVVGREQITTAAGPRRAIHLSGRGLRINERDEIIGQFPWIGELWLSDDAYRLPLYIKAETILGMAEFSLTSYEAGSRPLAVPRNPRGITVETKSAEAKPASHDTKAPPAAK